MNGLGNGLLYFSGIDRLLLAMFRLAGSNDVREIVVLISSMPSTPSFDYVPIMRTSLPAV